MSNILIMNKLSGKLSLCFQEHRLYFFFASCILICSYISDRFISVNYICLSIVSFIILDNAQKSIKDKALDVLAIIIIWLSLKIPLIFPLAILIIDKNKSITNKGASLYFNTLISFSLLVFLSENIEILSVVASIGIYFWGLGYVIIALMISYILKKHVKIVLISACIIVSIMNILNQDNATTYYFAGKTGNQFESKMATLLSNKLAIADSEDFSKPISESKIIVPFNAVKDFYDIYNPKTINNCEIFLFGEHDNLQNFAEKSVFFNNDSYKRKSPWTTYAPLMNNNLKIASSFDSLYCSNIGSTLKNTGKNLPLIWTYSDLGIPKLLAARYKTDNNYFTVFGDSDPIVPFLMPYNINFLKYIFFKDSKVLYFNIILFSAMVIVLYQKSFIFIIILATFLVIFDNDKIDEISKSEIFIKYDDKILSPHYLHHFGSLTSEIVKKNIVATHEENSKRIVDIFVISKPTKHINLKPDIKQRIIFLLPGGSVSINNVAYTCTRIPLGKEKVTNSNKEFYIEDAYNIFDNPMVFLKSTIIIGTGSPQRNVNLIENILNDIK